MRFPYQRHETPTSPVDGSTERFRPEILLHLIGDADELFVFGFFDIGADGLLHSGVRVNWGLVELCRTTPTIECRGYEMKTCFVF